MFFLKSQALTLNLSAAAESAPAIYGGPIEGLESRVEEADQASYASGLEAQVNHLVKFFKV